MDKTLEDGAQAILDDWHRAEDYDKAVRRAVEMAIRRAAKACRERAAFFDLHGSSYLAKEGDECAAAILKLLD
jgi:hypothetical protein